MGYEFERDESVDEAVRRIAGEEIDGALDLLGAIGGDDTDVPGAIHEARKACKRVRGLVRLVRPALDDAYDRANAAARDAARHLSDVRDAHALVGTFDDLVAVLADQLPRDGVTPVRNALVERAARATDGVVRDRTPVVAARGELERLRAAVDDWPLVGDLLDAVAAGAARTAGRGRNRFDEVAHGAGRPSDHLLHQWRKRVKYSWYHASLLEPAAPTLLGVHADLLHDLADALGDDHDLAVLADALRYDPTTFGGPEVVQDTLVLVEGTRADLQRRAVAVGARIHAEHAEAWGERLVGLLGAWWEHGPERAAGELADLHDVVDDLGEWTTGQLRDLARRVDLAGRSSMDRPGLLASLRAASASPG